MSGREHFTDRIGGQLIVAKSPHPGPEGVLIDTAPEDESQNFCIRPHELAAVVAAMYEVAGQPVPVLPVIHDPAEVTWLAVLLSESRNRQAVTPGVADRSDAEYLLAHGVRLPEATNG